jgi:hypothetical protein
LCEDTREKKTVGDKSVLGGENLLGHRRKTHHVGGIEAGTGSKPRGQPSAIASPSTPTYTNMDVREPFSRLKKKIKHRQTGSKHKLDGMGADAGGERADATGSLPHTEPHVVTGSGDPNVEVVVGSGFHREENSAGEGEVEQVNPTPSAPSLERSERPGGA